MAVPLPASNDVASWKTLLKRLARSFRHRAPSRGVFGEGFLIWMCCMKFINLYPQLLYRFGNIFYWPVNGYATWINNLAKVFSQSGATQVEGDLLIALQTLCHNIDASRYNS
jgi:hypothetical protein